MDQQVTFSAAKRTQLWETVLESLRTAIVNGVLAPGTQIIETEIAEKMSVSRWPVRQAITRLEQEHLVVTYPNRGAFVVGLTREDIREIYALRRLLELYALQQAMPRMTPEHLKEMSGLIEEMERSMRIGNVQQFITSDLAFHQKVMDVSGSKRLTEMWEMLAGPLRPLLIMGATLIPNVSENLGPRHQILVEAYGSGDIQKAVKALEAHLNDAEQRSLRFMDSPVNPGNHIENSE